MTGAFTLCGYRYADGADSEPAPLLVFYEEPTKSDDELLAIQTSCSGWRPTVAKVYTTLNWRIIPLSGPFHCNIIWLMSDPSYESIGARLFHTSSMTA